MEKDKRATVLVFSKLKREQKRELKGGDTESLEMEFLE